MVEGRGNSFRCNVFLATAFWEIFLPVVSEYWNVIEGSCVESGNCLASKNYPDEYPPHDGCKIDIPQSSWAGKEIEVMEFKTEGCCDKLEVNGIEYKGINGPKYVKPSGQIIWSSDERKQNDGWRICAVPVPTPSPRSAAHSGGDDSSSEGSGATVIILVAVVAVLVLICVGALAMVTFCKRKSEASKKLDPVSPPSAAMGIPPPVPGPSPGSGPAAMAIPPPPVAAAPSGASSSGPSETVNPLERIIPPRCKVETPPSELQVPEWWNNQSAGEAFFSLQSVSSEDVNAIQSMMDNSFKKVATRDRLGSMPGRLKVCNVQRIENGAVWNRYAHGRYFIRQKRPTKYTQVSQYGGDLLTLRDLPSVNKRSLQMRVNEVYLWHGTSPKGANAIAQTGFKMKYAGSNVGTMYGTGCYFAESSSKSDEYAVDDKDGIYKGMYSVLLCRVVLGELLHMTTGGEKTYAMIKSAIEGEAYDSVLGDREASVGTYREYVVYSEDQVYPEYLVLYQREDG